jgi:LacI family transcriptional regulator
MSQVTLMDVAKAAGVSVATASRALAGKNRVSAETIARVRAVANRIGYRVDPIARALREGSTRTIGMVVPVIGNPYFAQLVDAVEAESHRHGFELLLADSHGDLVEEARRLTVLAERRADGIVVVPSGLRSSDAAIRSVGGNVPVIQIDRYAGPSVADFVGVDNAVGIDLVLEHLVERGARTVVYVGADAVTSSGIERFEAFERTAARLDLEVCEPVRRTFSMNTGRLAAEELLGRGELPDAIVTAADLIAFGLISRLKQGGVNTPGDVLVTGFDGTSLCEVFCPTLTTVVQPVEAMAADAIAFLLGRVDGSDGPVRTSRIAPALRAGESSAP